jgi:regulatory factor X, other
MVPIKAHSVSTTAVPAKTRKRPQSRASTTSIHSAATQSVSDQQFVDQPQDYQKHWYENQGNAHQQQHRFEGMEHQMSPEDMVMRSASQLQNPREYGIDPALEAAVNHSLEYPQGGPYRPDNTRHSLPADGYGTSFAEDDSPMLEGRSDEQDEIDSLGGNGATRKVPKSSAANEMEMRQLFQSNKHRTLPEVARELHGNERGPQSERTRQVFAMLWYVTRPDPSNLLLADKPLLLGSMKFVTKEKAPYLEVECMPITCRDARRNA